MNSAINEVCMAHRNRRNKSKGRENTRITVTSWCCVKNFNDSTMDGVSLYHLLSRTISTHLERPADS